MAQCTDGILVMGATAEYFIDLIASTALCIRISCYGDFHITEKLLNVSLILPVGVYVFVILL